MSLASTVIDTVRFTVPAGASTALTVGADVSAAGGGGGGGGEDPPLPPPQAEINNAVRNVKPANRRRCA